MLEALAHREGRRGKNPAGLVARDLPGEHLGDVDRCAVQAQALAEHLEPADHLFRRFRLAQLAELQQHRLGARQAGIEPLAAPANRIQHALQIAQLVLRRIQRLLHLGVVLDLGPGAAPLLGAESQAQVLRGLFEFFQLVENLRQVARLVVVLDGGVVHQLEDLPGAQGAAEEVARHLGQLVRLVDDEGIGGRQQLAEAGVLDRKIRAQQVMVHHHDVGLLRHAARLDQVTLAVSRAILAQAVVCGGGDQRPDPGIFRHRAELGDVAALGGVRPVAHRQQPAEHFLVVAARVVQRVFHAMHAQVVGAPLEQRDPRRAGHRLDHARQVAQKQLVLQVARAGGNQHLLARQQRRHQVGVGLAGAGAGLGDQVAALLEGAHHRLGHLRLLRAVGKAVQLPRQQAVGAQYLLDFGLHVGEEISRPGCPRPRPGRRRPHPTPARR